MKKYEIVQDINDSIINHNLCRVGYKYDDFLRYLFPLMANDKLFLSSKENDFDFGGYHIGKISNIDTIDTRTKGDKLFDIIDAEGLQKYLELPNVDLSDWKTVFESLQKLKKYIIVKNEKDYESECSFVIGEIFKVTSKYVTMRNFDCDGKWEENLYEIPFSKITSVEFNTRYCNVFSKYI